MSFASLRLLLRRGKDERKRPFGRRFLRRGNLRTEKAFGHRPRILGKPGLLQRKSVRIRGRFGRTLSLLYPQYGEKRRRHGQHRGQESHLHRERLDIRRGENASRALRKRLGFKERIRRGRRQGELFLSRNRLFLSDGVQRQRRKESGKRRDRPRRFENARRRMGESRILARRHIRRGALRPDESSPTAAR